jgi:hypothetical protein
MGRLSHLTRLALGRSAFGDALRDEDGSFVISNNAHENDAAGYVQAYNERGHPINEYTGRADRRLRRAQNEVLKVVGVVRSRHEKEYQASREQGLSNDELTDMLDNEQLAGVLMRVLIIPSTELASWWIVSLRARLLVRTARLHLALADKRRHFVPTWNLVS